MENKIDKISGRIIKSHIEDGIEVINEFELLSVSMEPGTFNLLKEIDKRLGIAGNQGVN